MFCIKKNCKTTHLGNKVVIGQNTICVVKPPDVSLFCEPTMKREQVDASLYVSWMTEKATLEEWAQCFGIASASADVLNKDLLKSTKAFKEKARMFKTPNKSSQKIADAEVNEMLTSMETENLYKRKLRGELEFNKITNNDWPRSSKQSKKSCKRLAEER
jgi:hypothetical protein